MSDIPHERLIQTAVRPLSDNVELQHSAADFLSRISTGNAEEAEAMASRWENVDGRKKSWWPIGRWAALGLISAAVLIADAEEAFLIAKLVKWSTGFSFLEPDFPKDPQKRIAARLSKSEKLLLFGDLSKINNDERKEALWRSDPENPAYFADYAAAYMSEQNELPKDYFEISGRIDPDNAWFTYQAAALEARDAVKKERRPSRRVDGKTVYDSPQTWEILDQARLDRSLELLRKARNQPRFTNYGAEMLRQRLPLLPQETLLDQLDSSFGLGGISVASSIRLRILSDLISARAWSLGEAGDVAGFHELVADSELFLQKLYRDENGLLVDELVKAVIVAGLSESFATTAETLELEADAARWKAISDRVSERSQSRDSRQFLVDGKPVEQGMVTGTLGSIEMLARQSEIQVPVSNSDLKPMRLMDHELLSRVSGYVSWLAMALCLGCAASYRYRVAALSRRLAGRMEQLLRQADWAWIIGAGVVVPFIFVMAINRLTPLGGREFGIQGTALLMPAAHFLGLWILWLVVPVQLIRWRMARRAGSFGFAGSSWLGWLAIASAFAFVPVIGWVAVSQPEAGSWLNWVESYSAIGKEAPRLFLLALGLAGVPLLYLLGQISFALLGRADRQLYRAVSASVMVKVLGVSLLLLALAIPIFKAAERHWFRQDRMTKFDLTTPGWSVFESKVAAQAGKELKEILGY
jgi:hypothetical protein